MAFTFFRSRPERTLGKAKGRRYDLPLNRNDNARFLTTLVGLMTFLAVLSISAFCALGAMAERWTSGLEDKATIEIPAETKDGILLKPDELSQLSQTAASILKNHPAIKSWHVLTAPEIQELVKPWLGDYSLDPEQMPLPGLISVEMRAGTTRQTLQSLAEKIAIAAPGARMDTHENWLKDVLRFTNALQFAATLLIAVIGLTTVIAVAGAVRARLAIHRSDVELLHLMGAADSYISSQFQRHSLLLGLTGAGIGMMAGILTLALIGWLSGEMDVNLLPDYRISFLQASAIFALPFAMAGLAAVTARQTVLHELSKMP